MGFSPDVHHHVSQFMIKTFSNIQTNITNKYIQNKYCQKGLNSSKLILKISELILSFVFKFHGVHSRNRPHAQNPLNLSENNLLYILKRLKQIARATTDLIEQNELMLR